MGWFLHSFLFILKVAISAHMWQDHPLDRIRTSQSHQSENAEAEFQ